MRRDKQCMPILNNKEVKSLRYALLTLKQDVEAVSGFENTKDNREWLKNSTDAYNIVLHLSVLIGAIE
jgi:hypothetical protein